MFATLTLYKKNIYADNDLGRELWNYNVSRKKLLSNPIHSLDHSRALFRTYGEHHGNCDTAYPQVETVFLSIFIVICLKEGFKLNLHLRKKRKN